MTAYETGRCARRTGRLKCVNPHPEHSEDWTQWNEGWNDSDTTLRSLGLDLDPDGDDKMIQVYILEKDGGFLCGDTASGMTACAYPTSKHATDAKRRPDAVARAMLAGELASFRQLPAVAERDRHNWTKLNAAVAPDLTGEPAEPRASFSGATVDALSRNGWTVVSPHRASRTYRGAITSTIDADGRWQVTGPGGNVRLCGTDRDAICAAMEANNRAWQQPEYRREPS